MAAIREACEETGLCLGRKVEGHAKKLSGVWSAFSDAGLLPDPSGLFLIARAITPPGRIKRFDTRFFTADASAIAHRIEGVIHADAELVELSRRLPAQADDLERQADQLARQGIEPA